MATPGRKKGSPGLKETRNYYRQYRSNMHELFDRPDIQYKLSRVLITMSSINAFRNAKNKGSMPSGKTFNTLAQGLFKIQRPDMNFDDYTLWLLDPAPEKQ